MCWEAKSLGCKETCGVGAALGLAGLMQERTAVITGVPASLQQAVVLPETDAWMVSFLNMLGKG